MSGFSRTVAIAGVLGWGLLGTGSRAPAQTRIPAADAPVAVHWVATWAAPFVSRLPMPPPAPPLPGVQPAPPPANFKDQTIRQIVHTSIGGDRVRAVFNNVFGTAGLQVGAAHISLRDTSAAIVVASDRALAFGGSPSTTIPAGAVMVSDPVNLLVPALADLAVDLYLPGDTAAGTSPLTTRNGAAQTNYISGAGNHAGEADLPGATTTQAWFFLARVEVAAPTAVGALVGLGDSITAGARSTPDTNNRWLDHLARRLLAPGAGVTMAVLNAGIAGNRILGDNNGALARFDRDVASLPGVTHLIFLEGVNDIGARQNASTAAEVIAAHRQIIERAHARGLQVYGGTILPFEGSTLTLWTPENEVKRQDVNRWIRTSHAYDAVIDFDAVVRDPSEPTKIRAEWDADDHIHPNDAGYAAMAQAIDLALFGARAVPVSQAPSR